MRTAASALVLSVLVLVGSSCSSESARRPAVVFDIDGTLTTEPIDPVNPREGAQEAVRRYVDKGYEVVYVTARPDLFESVTEAWLRLNDFPELRLEMAPGVVIDDEETAELKTGTLEELEEELGIEFRYAYGDSASDFVAYETMGIPSTGVFALQREGRTDCEPGAYEACLEDFLDHLSVIDDLPDA